MLILCLFLSSLPRNQVIPVQWNHCMCHKSHVKHEFTLSLGLLEQVLLRLDFYCNSKKLTSMSVEVTVLELVILVHLPLCKTNNNKIATKVSAPPLQTGVLFCQKSHSDLLCLCQPLLDSRLHYVSVMSCSVMPLLPLPLAHLPVITHFQHCCISRCLFGLDWNLPFSLPSLPSFLSFFHLLMVTSHFSSFPWGQRQRKAGIVGILKNSLCPPYFFLFFERGTLKHILALIKNDALMTKPRPVYYRKIRKCQ